MKPPIGIHVVLAALALAALSSCGGEKAKYRSCESGCTTTEVCWYARDICVPQPSAGACTADYVYRDCATGSCPTCRDCVPACLPAELAT